jgi:hypothetical protein
MNSDDATAPTKGKRNRLKDWLIRLLIIGLVLPVAAGGEHALDAVLVAPWGYSLGVRPTLTGSWLGIFDLPSGLELALYLDVRHDALALGEPKLENFTGAALSGEASWCDGEDRQALDVPIGGAVPLLSGYNTSVDHVEIDIENGLHPHSGLLPDTLTGKWEAGSLLLQPSFAPGKELTNPRDDPDFTIPILIRLKKASEVAFRTACVSIGSTNRDPYAHATARGG